MTDLPPEVNTFEGGTFTAYLCHDLEIAPGQAEHPYRGLREKVKPDVLKKIIAAQREEVRFALRSADLTPEMLEDRALLTRNEREYLYWNLRAARSGAIDQEEYKKRREGVEKVSELVERIGRLTPEEWTSFTKAMISSQKIGLRNFSFDKDESGKIVARFDYVSGGVPFQFYRLFADSTQLKEHLDLARPTATAMVVVTRDDKLILQYRSELNARYREVPGTSVAGLWDETLDDNGNHILPSSDSARNNILKEAREELQLNPEDFTDVKLTGFAQDRVAIHSEILFLGKLGLTLDQLEERIKGEKTQVSGFDFSEKFFTIDATSGAVEKFLTEAKCPMPSTHAATLVAFCVSLKRKEFKQGGYTGDTLNSKVREYTNWLELAVKKNYQEMDEVVGQYWISRGMDKKSYDPTLTPWEQGLPEMYEELIRNDLVDEGTKPKGARVEKRKFEEGQAWILDVDGVITDLDEHSVTWPRMMGLIEEKLKMGDPVCLNTGRSLDFVKEKVIRPLLAGADDKSFVENLVVIGEMGGVWGTVSPNGEIDTNVNEVVDIDRLRVLKEALEEQISGVDYHGQWEDKLTMATYSVKPGENTTAFNEVKNDLAQQFQIIIEELGFQDEFEVSQSTIAVDIISKKVGKDEGARLFAKILAERDITPPSYLVLGDSPSDLKMVDGLSEQNVPVTVVYVGKEEDLSKEVVVDNIMVVGDYTRGAVGVLQNALRE